jgi:hypothetical protein
MDVSLLRNAAKLTGVKEKPSLVRLGLDALISKESADAWLISEDPRSTFTRFEDTPRNAA